ncbi:MULTISPECIES: TRAP transporter large permease [Oceanibaculum]|jgi:tripartite ATP-independent transporter DctM subunit|uniref:TRAP transporter large permease protein n=2 Tax=Oceanibaculum indicum TaxID=526216 RepID=K2K7R3_9PROT|nr:MULTISPECIES: TRAP transporter large permease subunit [Oceanibaculum]EKE78939.1 TRAP transporter subunit DctM [Oceanibaculum indicum P24]MCH2395247.1 TRAP transporter large permease subunit [Oceanibaculum sp.]RKQ72370.1 tripartite ATP-independent transporter DctM subunit [Oceanibaculum indicum]
MTGLALWMFPALLVFVAAGIPIAFSLMSVALVFGLLRFGDAAVAQFISKVDDVSTNYILGAIPLFVFMGALLERSGIASRLFDAIHLWTRRLPGGLAIGSVIMCTVFAAATGITGATETVVGMLAIPAMMKYAYDKGLISGTICAGGSLGTIIPPSVIVVVLAPVADIPVGDLFAGIMFPGLIMSGLFLAYIVIACTLNPSLAPREAAGPEDDIPLAEKLRITFVALLPPVFLICAVLGTILLGWATPTEAAATGAFGSILLCFIYRQFSLPMLKEALYRTLSITAMILLIVLGGSMFAGVFYASGGMVAIQKLLAEYGLAGWPAVALILFMTFLAGFVLELISIVLIVIPIAIPLVKLYGIDPLWFSVLFLVILQTSYLTPPMAPAIFYLRAIAPPSITLMHMYKGVIPFICMQILTLALVFFFPALATWLPKMLYSMN